MDQKVRFAFSCCGVWVQETAEFPQLLFMQISLVCAEADFHGPCDHGDSPVTRGYGYSMALFCSCAFPCRVAEACSHGPGCSADPVLHARSHPCRDAESDPHGLVDHGDSAVAGGHG